ncbi:MAG: hypothetical protein QOI45_708 [Thermoleophilaceae bacterium]|jgi:uncharacterized protein YbcI|nr:hypothetical protein [Thermoleophilaceae bacterium]
MRPVPSSSSVESTIENRPPSPPNGQLNASIANAVVRTMNQRTGRGPTKARAFIRRNLVVILLEEQLTPSDHSLVAAGEAKTVQALRRELQRTLGPDLVPIIEQLTSAGVVAFLSDDQVDPEIAVQVFVLDRDVTP